jgi:hypothetical protein
LADASDRIVLLDVKGNTASGATPFATCSLTPRHGDTGGSAPSALSVIVTSALGRCAEAHQAASSAMSRAPDAMIVPLSWSCTPSRTPLPTRRPAVVAAVL